MALLKAHQGRIGILALLRVAARGFAQRGRIRHHIQNIVGDLKGHTQR